MKIRDKLVIVASLKRRRQSEQKYMCSSYRMECAPARDWNIAYIRNRIKGNRADRKLLVQNSTFLFLSSLPQPPRHLLCSLWFFSIGRTQQRRVRWKRTSVFSCRPTAYMGYSWRVVELLFIFIFVASPVWCWYSLYLSNSIPGPRVPLPLPRRDVSPHLYIHI